MNITNAQYVSDPLSKMPPSIKATINGVEVFVPTDPDNRHYAEIMRQVEAGELVVQEADQ